MCPPPTTPAAETRRFPEIAGIDRERAEMLLKDEREFFLELLRQFASQYGGTAAQIEALLARGDRPAAAACLHKVRGTASYLGVTELVNVSRELEQSIKTETGDVRSLLAGYAAAMSALLAAAAPWLDDAIPPSGGSDL